MRLTLIWLSAALAILLFSALWARSDWKNVAQEWAPYLDKMTPDQQKRTKDWFRGVKAPSGVPCCNMADGHPTLEDWRGQNEYWVPNPLHVQNQFTSEWIQVPSEAVIHDAGNPTGEAIVWYVIQGEGVFIRCFIPGGGV